MWENEQNIKNAAELVTEFHQNHPAAPQRLNIRTSKSLQFVPYSNNTVQQLFQMPLVVLIHNPIFIAGTCVVLISLTLILLYFHIHQNCHPFWEPPLTPIQILQNDQT